MTIYNNVSARDAEAAERERTIYRVTLGGSAVNAALVVVKLAAGLLGHSAAMVADAVHSLSDFLTDLAVLVFVRLSNKPQDHDHDYGHGKYETLASATIGIALLVVGVSILLNGVGKIWAVIGGEVLPRPGWVALVAAVVSIAGKEWCYQFTARAGRRVHSEAVIANAWHHRSDALSSIGTAIGIGGAIMLGERWTVLDPVAAAVVGVLIIITAAKLTRQALDELLEKSLPDDVEDEIRRIADSEPQVSLAHNLRTRRIGNRIAIEMHVRMPGETTLYDSHLHAINIERCLRQRFGASTHITLHVEPLKVDGEYRRPECRA